MYIIGCHCQESLSLYSIKSDLATSEEPTSLAQAAGTTMSSTQSKATVSNLEVMLGLPTELQAQFFKDAAQFDCSDAHDLCHRHEGTLLPTTKRNC